MPTDTRDYSLSTAQPPDFLTACALVGSQALTPFPLSPGAGTVGLVLATASNQNAIQPQAVLGATTSNQYWNSVGDIPLTVGFNELFIPLVFDPARDPILHLYLQNLSAFDASVDVFGVYQLMPLLGRSSKAVSQPVVLASDQNLYDGQGFSHPAAGSQASVTLAANVNGRWLADAWAASLQSGGTAGALSVVLVDGPLGGATLLDGAQIGVTAAAGNIDRLPERRGHYAGALISTALTVQFSATLLGAAQQISLGAYLA